uniref:BED-type domain-containing protein n=1 Tax=Lactuca sativa TaxID=4236 RepID=A0A9R1UED0_LACSA|nr:hypothetical protein LSAT_V11C900474930 [Lactuca sativa]
MMVTNVDEEEFIKNTPQINLVGYSAKDDQSNFNKRKEQMGKRKQVAKKASGKETSSCWDTFDKVMIEKDDGVKKRYGKCYWCERLLQTDMERNGTSSLLKHVSRCQKNPDKLQDQTQTKLNLKKESNGETTVKTWKHDDARIKKALLNLFVVGELPFKFVENEAFVEYTNALNAKVVLASRHTISQNVSKFYTEERTKMLQLLSNPNTAIHLTTDTWTSSCQMTTYMVVTTHFIDENWIMHKRLTNFREIDNHKGEDMGQELLDCICGWGMKNVMTITLDNVATNIKAIDFLVKKLPNLYDGGKHFQVRCMTHILNLIVKDGQKYKNYHVECIQKVVRELQSFKVELSKLKYFSFLDIILDYNSEFYVSLTDKSYEMDLSRVPENYGFEVVTEMVKLFEKFKTQTELVRLHQNLW